jgi:transcriptional regulator GlxA family with amidase domain
LLRVAAQARVRLAAACTGTFMLAEAGLLNGLTATTSWWLAASFRHQYPNVYLSADDVVVDSGTVMTGGAATSFVQMCLMLIAQTAGKDMADNIGRLMLVDPSRHSQAPYVNRALEQKNAACFQRKC